MWHAVETKSAMRAFRLASVLLAAGLIAPPGAQAIPPGATYVGELKDGQVREYSVHPDRFGLPVHDIRSLKVGTVEESRAMVLSALENKPGAARDIVALNAGAAIYVAGKAESFEDGVESAMEQMRSGAARAKLDAYVAFTQGF